MSDLFDAQAYWEQRLSFKPGLHSVGHLAYGSVFNKALYSLRKQLVVQTFVKYLSANSVDTMAVLDIGCGTGFYISIWKQLGYRSIAGLDFTQSAVDICTQSFPEYLMYKADISSIEDTSSLGMYDCISVFDVLFHIVDNDKYDQAIQNIAQHLHPGGILFYSDNFLHHATKKEKHIVHRSLQEITDCLNSYGIEIVKRIPMFYLMGYPIDMKSPLWGRLWNIAMYPVRKSESIGALYACILYPIEWLLIRICKESPTTEMMICKKKAQ